MSTKKPKRKARPKCPLCKSPLYEQDAVNAGNSVTGDALADHLLDYHQRLFVPSGMNFGQAVKEAKKKAEELRQGERPEIQRQAIGS